jgi:hypothetical protein
MLLWPVAPSNDPFSRLGVIVASDLGLGAPVPKTGSELQRGPAPLFPVRKSFGEPESAGSRQKMHLRDHNAERKD